MKFYVPNIEGDSSSHGDLPKSQRVQEIIEHILFDGVKSSQALLDFGLNGDKMDITPAVNQGLRIQYQLHSAAPVPVTDSLGSHMGLNEFGGIDEEIPGGSHLIVDDLEFSAIQTPSGSYTITVVGTENGVFSLTLHNIFSGGEVVRLVYPEIETGPGRVAEVVIAVAQITEDPPPLILKDSLVPIQPIVERDSPPRDMTLIYVLFAATVGIVAVGILVFLRRNK